MDVTVKMVTGHRRYVRLRVDHDHDSVQPIHVTYVDAEGVERVARGDDAIVWRKVYDAMTAEDSIASTPPARRKIVRGLKRILGRC